MENKFEDRFDAAIPSLKTTSDLLLFSGCGLYVLLKDIEGVNRLDNARLDGILKHNLDQLHSSDYLSEIAKKPEEKEKLIKFLSSYANLTKEYMEFIKSNFNG